MATSQSRISASALASINGRDSVRSTSVTGRHGCWAMTRAGSRPLTTAMAHSTTARRMMPPTRFVAVAVPAAGYAAGESITPGEWRAVWISGGFRRPEGLRLPVRAPRPEPRVPSLLPRIARFRDADRLERASHWWCGHALRRHQLAQQGAGLGMADGRLHAHAHEAVGVVHRLPGVHRKRAAAVVRVAVVAHVELGATVGKYLDDVRAPLVSGAMQRRTAGVGLQVDVEPEVDQQLDRIECGLGRPLVGDPL